MERINRLLDTMMSQAITGKYTSEADVLKEMNSIILEGKKYPTLAKTEALKEFEMLYSAMKKRAEG